MLFRQMKYFVAIVDCGSFTEAAERCYVSQSAISQQMSALEAELGVKLFERDGRKFRLTPAGDYFYGKSRSLLASAEEVCAETKRIGSDSELKLSIGYLAGYYGYELQEAVVGFSRVYPEVAVDIFKGSHEELYRALQDGRASLVMSDRRRAFSDEYENYVLAQGPAYADVSADGPLAGKEYLTVDRLADVPCILVAEKSEEETERRFYAETLGIGREYLFAASRDEARLLAMSGRGCMLVESVRGETEPPLLRREVRRADGSPIVRTYCAFWQKKRTSYYIEEFADILRRQFAKNQ